MAGFSNWSQRAAVLAVFGMILTAAFVIAAPRRSEAWQEKAESWSTAEVLRPEDFVAELSRKAEKHPVVLYVGFRTLFEGAHVPGARFLGSASTEKGLTDLTAGVANLPRASDIVIYCGCCPFVKCPNIRPAYKALREMGFTRLRVLSLPTSFAADWVEKGYPIEKGL